LLDSWRQLAKLCDDGVVRVSLGNGGSGSEQHRISGLVVAPESGDWRIKKEAACFDLNKAAR
jgi:hypothetical protein